MASCCIGRVASTLVVTAHHGAISSAPRPFGRPWLSDPGGSDLCRRSRPADDRAHASSRHRPQPSPPFHGRTLALPQCRALCFFAGLGRESFLVGGNRIGDAAMAHPPPHADESAYDKFHLGTTEAAQPQLAIALSGFHNPSHREFCLRITGVGWEGSKCGFAAIGKHQNCRLA